MWGGGRPGKSSWFPCHSRKLLRCLSAPFTHLPSRGRACLATKAFFPHLGAGGCCAITSGCWLGAGVGQEKPSPAGLQPPGPHIEGKKSEAEVGKSIWLRSRGESPLATSLCLLKCDHLSDLAPPTTSLPPPLRAIPSPHPGSKYALSLRHRIHTLEKKALSHHLCSFGLVLESSPMSFPLGKGPLLLFI